MVPNNIMSSFFFFFNDTATTEIYTLSLHDALPIYDLMLDIAGNRSWSECKRVLSERATDRKSTRLNSSHSQISYAVFCLKKKKQNTRSIIIAPNASSFSSRIATLAAYRL